MALLKTDTRVFGTLNVNTAILIGNTTSSLNLVPFIGSVFTRANNTVNANTGGTVTGNTVIRGNLIVTNTTTSVSNTTGALQISGGVGVTGNVYADGLYDGRNSNLPVGYLNVPRSGTAKTTNYTLATSDVGEFIEIGVGGSVAVPDAIFSTGDAITIFNNTAANAIITLNITTAYIAGFDTDRTTANLTTRGIATILFSNSTTCVIIGNVS
jgi:hypothetical protein